MNEIKKGVELDALLSLRKGSRAMAEDKNKYILSINGMSKSFGRNKVLKHIDQMCIRDSCRSCCEASAGRDYAAIGRSAGYSVQSGTDYFKMYTEEFGETL